jgi:DNA-directed RNA polymerase subunit beta'
VSDLTPEKSFETLKSNVVNTIQSYFPFEGRKQQLVVENVRVEDHLSHDDVSSQAEAKDKEGTWGVPIKADVKLIDKATGKVVDSKKGQILGRLPKLTNRYGFIVNGNEYQIDHLFRLKSGVYARVQDNGDLETEFNLAKSPTGKGFSVKLEQGTKRFSLKLDNAHIPLYPVLKAAGVSDDQMERAWGKEIFAANRPRTEEKFHKSLAEFWKRTSDEGTAMPTDSGDLAKHVNSFLDQTALRPDTTAITLGKPVSKVDGQVLQMASEKILGVARGTHKPDDRDSLAFKEIACVEDFIPEKIARNARTIRAKLRNTIDHKNAVGEVLSTELFNRPIHEFFLKGGSVAERSDQTNPIQMLSAHRKTTVMSRELGGINSERKINEDMRKVNPSHLGFLDPIHTPESERTGITLHLAAGVKKNGRDLETQTYNLKTGKTEWLKVGDFHQTTAILPDQVKWVNGKPVPIAKEVKVKLPGGDVAIRPASQATHVLPSAKAMFNYATNLVPFLPCDNGNRVSMADKQIEQSISLKNREAPLVQAKTDHQRDPGHTFEKLVGGFVCQKATVDGTVVSVKNDVITIKGADGKKAEVHLYNHFPLNDPKGMMHSSALVKPGDKVKAGQVIADTNFTKNGTLAYGTNLRVGYLPFKGYNFEDGIVISETAAKKLTSEHLFKKALEIDSDSDVISKDKLKAHAAVRATQVPREHWEALDDEGVIKAGTKVMPGQILVAAVGKNNATKANHAWGALGKKALSPYKDKSLTWDEDHVGVVTKVVRLPGGKGVKVYVKTEEQAVVGDKLAGRHGNKGIITQILPDHEMPFTTDPKSGEKRHLEVALNPSGVPTRINTGQVLETAAAKIAEKTGKPYIVDNFAGPNHDYRAAVLEDLKKHGLTDEEHVYDPKDPRRPLGSVLVGPQYLLKLKHQVEKKLSVRGGGTDVNNRPLPYDIDKQPTKGGERGGQGFGALEMYSLLGHNARHNIREMATYKSDQQDMTFWSMVQEGHEPPPPRVPFAYQKFEALLKGLGVNVQKEGTAVRLLPMTNQEILKLAGNGRNEIRDGSKTLISKNLKPEPGGLFDPVATGGLDGDKWAHMRLAEPVPNPIFVGHNNMPGPIPALLNLKMKEIDSIMSGKMELDGKTGGKAIEAALKKVDVDAEIKKLKAELPALKEAPLDRANKKLKYLLALKETGLQPHEAYVLHHVPVIPPKFRPATTTPTGDVNYSSVNGLYKNISLINERIRSHPGTGLPDEELHPVRSQMWDAMKALQSVGSYKPVYDVDQSGNRELKGILDIIGGGEGEQPKEGFFQSKLVKRKQDLSMRSTIVPEPALNIDEVGLPRNAAMELYKPFVVGQLHRWGLDPLTAQQEMRKSTALAFKALEHVVADRPILLKRDPALHRASVQAFRPKLVEGKAIQIHPLVCGGFNADFDGDTMAATVPVSREAVEEAKKMMPSANLFSPTHGGVMYELGQEQIIGLHYLAKWGKKSGKTFATISDAKKAYDRGDIQVSDVIKLKGAPETTLGRLMIAERLPSGFGKNKDVLHNQDLVVTKKLLNDELVSNIAKDHPQSFAKTIDGLKNLGNEWSYRLGASFGLKDFAPLKERDAIIAKAHREVEQLKKTVKDPKELEAKTVDAYQKATAELESTAKNTLFHSDNRLAHLVYSGARGKPEQLRQMIAAPMLMQDASNRIIPVPVTKSFAEGLDFGDYWLTQHGARKGTLQRSQGTSEPGAISKDIINSTMNTLVVSNDCKTNQGVLMDLTHKDVHDRFLAAPYKLRDGTVIKAGEMVTPSVTSRLKNSKIDRILVRSPLKCAHGDGICAKCFGLNENGKLHDVGTNIGVLAGQSIGEPASQMSMDAFHSGGVAHGAGASSVGTFTRLRQIVGMPKTLKNAATLSTSNGTVTDVRKDAAGGVDVFVNGTPHHVKAHLVREDIKPGVEVKKGQKLSYGFTNPHVLLESTNDIHAVQNYLTAALHSQAVSDPKNSDGPGLFERKSRRRNIEVVVRALTNLTRVKDPGHSDYTHGDIVPRSEVEDHNRNLPKGKKTVEHEPILKGVSEIPALINPNWMARLNYQELHSTVQQAASRGAKAELHGTHPIPGIAVGTEFGKPPAGKPKYVY